MADFLQNSLQFLPPKKKKKKKKNYTTTLSASLAFKILNTNLVKLIEMINQTNIDQYKHSFLHVGLPISAKYHKGHQYSAGTTIRHLKA